MQGVRLSICLQRRMSGLNYLCKGYYQYFQHVAPYMDFMKKELMNQQAPANIMKALKDGSLKIEY